MQHYFVGVKDNIEDDVDHWFYNQSYAQCSLHIPYTRRINGEIHAVTRRRDTHSLNFGAQRRRK